MLEHSAEDYITALKMQPHPEGGYYAESYRGKWSEDGNHMQERDISTAIYFLLRANDISHFHRIKSDEMWHHYQGASLIISMIDAQGCLQQQRLGKNIYQGELLQFVVPAKTWFAAEVAEKKPENFALVGCTVAPGFDFRDFELAKSAELQRCYPQIADSIERLALP